MFDEMDRDIEAVIVATPDHTHAIIAATAMTLGKHVYVQKPLAHSIYESRLLSRLASEYRIATQMGNQGASGEDVDWVCWKRQPKRTRFRRHWIGICLSGQLE